jgi:hypothetical protein
MNNALTLYEIGHQYLAALDALTDPEADLPMQAIADTLEGIEGQLQDKAVNVAKFLRNLEAAAEAIKAAEDRMAKRRRALEGRAKWIKDYLKGNMEVSGITKIESPWFVLSVQKNPPAVEIIDERAIPDFFRTEVVTVTLDKQALKEALKAGEEVPGARMVNGTRLSIR